MLNIFIRQHTPFAIFEPFLRRLIAADIKFPCDFRHVACKRHEETVDTQLSISSCFRAFVPSCLRVHKIIPRAVYFDKMLIYNEKTCFETANIYVDLRNIYVGLRNIYVGLRNIYVGLCNIYVGLRNIYVGLRNIYATLRHIYTCFRLSRVMESRSMSMQEYLSLNIKAMFQPLSVPATGKARRQKAEGTKAQRYGKPRINSFFVPSCLLLSCLRAFVFIKLYRAQYN